jgi:hypothetical protein
VHQTTALYVLQGLARQEYLSVKHTTFRVEKYPQPVHLLDARECFMALADYMNMRANDYVVTLGHGLEVWTSDRFFEKLFKVIYANEKLYPVERHSRLQTEAPLPALFVGNEKTQVRQIPLVEKPPWPFKFLLELGGMIVVRPVNERDMLLELKQYVNNHPQFRLKVDAKKWPDGSVAIFTWWFEKLPRLERKKNVNVPTR